MFIFSEKSRLVQGFKEAVLNMDLEHFFPIGRLERSDGVNVIEKQVRWYHVD